MNPPALKIITDVTVVLPEGKTLDGSVLLEGNRIRAISTEAPGSLLLSHEAEITSGKGHYLTPGLIETHFNGALGCNFNTSSIADIQGLLKQLPAYGITSCLLTAITAPQEDMIATIHTLEEVIHHQHPMHCRALGLHLEGPFINPQNRGSHPANSVLAPFVEDLKLYASPNTKLVTLAPELDIKGDLIRYLASKNVRVSAGHSSATYADMQRAIEQGLSSVTHLYNAMKPFHHRDPGIIGAAFNEDTLYVQIIGEADHVNPEAIRMLVRGKNPKKIILVSDAYPMAGMPDGTDTMFGQQHVTMKNGSAVNEEVRLVGGHILLDDCVRNLVNWQILRFEDAVQLATANPAEFLGHGHELGKIAEGYTANLTLWDKNTLAIKATWVNGELAHNGNALEKVSA